MVIVRKKTKKLMTLKIYVDGGDVQNVFREMAFNECERAGTLRFWQLFKASLCLLFLGKIT